MEPNVFVINNNYKEKTKIKKCKRISRKIFQKNYEEN